MGDGHWATTASVHVILRNGGGRAPENKTTRGGVKRAPEKPFDILGVTGLFIPEYVDRKKDIEIEG